MRKFHFMMHMMRIMRIMHIICIMRMSRRKLSFLAHCDQMISGGFPGYQKLITQRKPIVNIHVTLRKSFCFPDCYSLCKHLLPICKNKISLWHNQVRNLFGFHPGQHKFFTFIITKSPPYSMYTRYESKQCSQPAERSGACTQDMKANSDNSLQSEAEHVFKT